MIGYSGSGKSTLVTALQSETNLFGAVFNVPQATPFTVGVIPNDFISSYYGSVQILDFAGHEEYHGNHELLFQNSPFPVVLITVALTLEVDHILGELHYWCNVLSNSLTHWTHRQCIANVVVMGSHYDKIINKDSVKDLDGKFETFFQKYLPAIMYNGFITLDCRKPASSGMTRLRKRLQKLCRSSRTETMKMSNLRTASAFKELEDFMTTHWSDTPALTMDDLCGKATLESFIPDTVSSLGEMFHLCEILSLLGVILLLRDDSNWSHSIVVRKEDSILHRIHSSIASVQPEDFRLVSLSRLTKSFEENDLKPNVAIRYLKYAQICTEVSSASFTEPPEFIAEDTYYFFPSFIKNEKPSNVPPPSPWSTVFYTWCLKCENPVTPRFLQVLFSQLMVPITGDVGNPKFTVWVNGMFIVGNDTTETLVEVTDTASKVMLQIRCERGKEISLLKRRSQLIFLLTDLLKRNCPLVNFTEYILEPQYPQSTNEPPQEVPLSDIAKAVIQRSPAVAVYDEQNTRPYLDLNSLLFFEPLRSLSTTTLKCFFLHPNEMVPRSVVECFYSAIEHECPGSSEASLISRSAITCTYQDLHDAVNKISIFMDKNLWVRQ